AHRRRPATGERPRRPEAVPRQSPPAPATSSQKGAKRRPMFLAMRLLLLLLLGCRTPLPKEPIPPLSAEKATNLIGGRLPPGRVAARPRAAPAVPVPEVHTGERAGARPGLAERGVTAPLLLDVDGGGAAFVPRPGGAAALR